MPGNNIANDIETPPFHLNPTFQHQHVNNYFPSEVLTVNNTQVGSCVSLIFIIQTKRSLGANMTDSDLYPWTVSKDYELARLVKNEPHIYRKPKNCICQQYTKTVNKTWNKLGRAMRTSAGKCKTRWAFLFKRYKNFVKTSTNMGRRSFLKNSAKALQPALSFIDDFNIDSSPVCPCTQKDDDDNQLKKKLKRSFNSEKPEEDKLLIRNFEQYTATDNSMLFIIYSNQRKCLHNFLRGDKKYKRLLNLV